MCRAMQTISQDVVKCSQVWYSMAIVQAMRTISPPTLITHQCNALTIISLVDTPRLIHTTHVKIVIYNSHQEMNQSHIVTLIFHPFQVRENAISDILAFACTLAPKPHCFNPLWAGLKFARGLPQISEQQLLIFMMSLLTHGKEG